ncbi:putative subtilisin-like protease-like [Capsicum annuum]|nr:putative subtilisin-like protease-like [Capsicum annuum]
MRTSFSPLDDHGPGTHTASTAEGGFLEGANVFGNANGTAVGIAPLAHLAIYKVCDRSGCPDSDILAGMDVAIDDGVDILSLSLGGRSKPFYTDAVALGAFSVSQRGILVSCAAGNSGPRPWILTIGASTHDRKIKATVKLGNQKQFEGESAFHPKDHSSTLLPLFNPALIAADLDSPYCGTGTLNDPNIRGKIVLCKTGGGYSGIGKGQAVKDAGGVGMIIYNGPDGGFTKSADARVLPALFITYQDGMNILAYMNSTSKQIARISFQGTKIGDKSVPVVASFSSRGPNLASPGILKPDIIVPGINVLSAWPTSVEQNINAKSTFNIISGTSMSCPSTE